MIYPNPNCIGFCNWMLNVASQRLTGSQITVCNNILTAATNNTAVTETEWNNFNLFASWRYKYYSVYRDFQSSYSSDLLTGLFGYYALEGNANDSLGANNGASTNVTYSTANGKILQGGGFNASNSKIELSGLSTYSFIQNTCVFSINLWCSLTVNNTNYGIFSNALGASEKGIYVRQTTNGELLIVIWNGSSITTSLVNITIPKYFLDNAYHMLTITGDGTYIYVYKDSLVIAKTKVGTLSTGNSSRTLNFGYMVGEGNYLGGKLDEIGIWNRCLNINEVYDLYNSGTGLTYPF